jgi:outer membrane protein TolC
MCLRLWGVLVLLAGSCPVWPQRSVVSAAAAGVAPPIAPVLRLSLADALQLAARRSPEIDIATLKTVEREADAAVLRSAYLPQISAHVANQYQTVNLRALGMCCKHENEAARHLSFVVTTQRT